MIDFGIYRVVPLHFYLSLSVPSFLMMECGQVDLEVLEMKTCGGSLKYSPTQIEFVSSYLFRVSCLLSIFELTIKPACMHACMYICIYS